MRFIGAIAVSLPEFLEAALPADDERLSQVRREIEQHLSMAGTYDWFMQHDSTIQPGRDDLLDAAMLIIQHIINEPDRYRDALARMPRDAILRFVYGPDRRPDLWD